MLFDRCPPEFVMLGHKLADAVRPITTQYFRDPPKIDYKDDNTPVTIADRMAEEKIREILTKERPQDGILGEEYGETNAGAEFQWILDPIDGTKPFTVGKATFGTLIGLRHKTNTAHDKDNVNDFVFGLCDQSVTNNRWTGAKGHPTLWNGHAVRARKNIPDDMLLGACVNPLRFDHDLREKLIKFSQDRMSISCGGDCLNFCLLASGRLDYVIETGQELYDVAALIPILKGAGCTIKMLDGDNYRPGDTSPFIAVADEKILQWFIS